MKNLSLAIAIILSSYYSFSQSQVSIRLRTKIKDTLVIDKYKRIDNGFKIDNIWGDYEKNNFNEMSSKQIYQCSIV